MCYLQAHDLSFRGCSQIKSEINLILQKKKMSDFTLPFGNLVNLGMPKSCKFLTTLTIKAIVRSCFGTCSRDHLWHSSCFLSIIVDLFLACQRQVFSL